MTALSTVKKSQASIDVARAVTNCRQVGLLRRGAGSTPARCRIFHTVLAAHHNPGRSARLGFAGDPRAVLPGQA